MIIIIHMHAGTRYTPFCTGKDSMLLLLPTQVVMQTTGIEIIMAYVRMVILTHNTRYLSKPDMVSRLHALQHKNRLSKLEVERLKVKLADVIAKQSVALDQDTSNDMKEVMQQVEEQAMKNCAKGSFQQVFWQQQKNATLKPDKRGIRWHPLFIKWCLYLRYQSGKAYQTLQESGCISLPSQRTLRDYSNCVQATAGFSSEVDRQLFQAANLGSCEEWQKLVCLLLDEMYIREDLVYNKHTGNLVGFCNLGEVNNHLLAFERSVDADGATHPPLAKTMMVFMVRGLFTPLRFAQSCRTIMTVLWACIVSYFNRYTYAQFPGASITGDLLFEPFWKAVYRLERLGLKVQYNIIICMHHKKSVTLSTGASSYI